MYNVSIEYKVDDSVQTLTANVRECFAHVSMTGHHCNVILANVADHSVFEKLAAEHNEVTKVSLTDSENNTVYMSEYWNCVESVNHSFPYEGATRCDVSFSRCNHDTHAEIPTI